MPQTNSLLEQFSAESVNSLQYLIERGSLISNESKSLSFIDSAKSTFQEFIASVTTFINGMKLGNYNKVTIDASELNEKLKTMDYSKTRKLTVTVPQGFTGQWVPFLELLINKILPAVSVAELTLRNVNTKLAIAVTEPDRLKAQSGIRQLGTSIALVDIDDFEKVKAHFNTDKKIEVTLNVVADRNADVDRAYQLINKLNAELGGVDFNAIQKLIDRLASLTSTLNDTLKKEEHTEMSGLITSQLSDLFYKIGVTLTAGAVLMDVTEQLTVAMTDSRDQLLQQMA